ncbi:MAG: hypothetical protein AAF430_10535 [Myxococcota bacterium]
MASDRWKESGGTSDAADARASGSRAGSDDGSDREEKRPGRRGNAPGAVPEFVRRALSAGFSGFFLTGETLREALGDSVPQEWADFASEQSSRARNEFIDRLSSEMGRAVEAIDWAAVITTLLEGRTLQVNAEIRLGEKDDAGSPTLQVKLADDD